MLEWIEICSIFFCHSPFNHRYMAIHLFLTSSSSFLHPSFIHSFDIRISKSYKLFVAFHLAMSIVSFCFERFAMWMNHTNHTIGLCLSTMSVVLFRFTLLLDESVVIINMVLPTESRDTTKEVEIWILKKRKNKIRDDTIMKIFEGGWKAMSCGLWKCESSTSS